MWVWVRAGAFEAIDITFLTKMDDVAGDAFKRFKERTTTNSTQLSNRPPTHTDHGLWLGAQGCEVKDALQSIGPLGRISHKLRTQNRTDRIKILYQNAFSNLKQGKKCTTSGQ